jgi:hypothetical protein
MLRRSHHDATQVEIVSLKPRPNPEGRTFGSNANAWFGFSARVPKADGTAYNAGGATSTPGLNDEVNTIYELVKSETDGTFYATPSYAFGWPTLTDPEGVERDYIQYPGTCVPHDAHGATTPSADVSNQGWVKKGPIEYDDAVYPAAVPVRVAPRSAPK